MLTHGSCQPRVAERDKHINQGDRSLLRILSHSLPLKKRKHLEIDLRHQGSVLAGVGTGNEVAREFQEPVISREGKSVSALCFR